MEVKTNFEMISRVAKFDSNHNLIKWSEGVTERNHFNYEILKSIISKLEKSLMVRKYENKKLEFRNISELLVQFVYNEVMKSNDEDLSYERKHIYKIIREEWRGIKLKKEASDNYGNKQWKIYHFLEAAKINDLVSQEELNTIVDFYRMANSEVHIIDENDIDAPIKGYFINDEFVLNPIKYGEFISMLGMVHESIKIIFKILYPDIQFNHSYDESAYDDGMGSLEHEKNWSMMDKIIGDVCVMCNEGRLFIPNSKLFPNGPFLECDNRNCKAKLSARLNLKENKNLVKCEKANCNGTYKRTASYEEGKPNYKEPFLQCNYCKEFGE